MNQNNYSCVSKCDGLILDVLEMYPYEEPKGIVQLVHGMSENKERYIKFMNYLRRFGYIVVIHDHRGHGKSIKKADDQGYFYDENAEYIVKDTLDITKMIKEKYPGLPVYLFGHSMGSLVALKYLKLYDDQIDKLVLCGTPAKNPLCGIAIVLVKLLEKIYGGYHRSKLVHYFSIGPYERAFKSSDGNSWLSLNEQNVQDYNDSKDCGFRFTLNGFKNLFLLMKTVYEENNWNKKNLSIPILFVAGEQDPVISSKEDWRQIQLYLNHIGYNRIKGKLYKKMRHEILNEARSDEVMEDIRDFLDQREGM